MHGILGRALSIKQIRSSWWKIGLFIVLVIVNYFHPSEPLVVGYKFLTGQNPRSDIGQDFYGFRAMIYHWDTYPALSEAYDKIGVEWDLAHASTHPPTAYLLTAPAAMFPWPIASALWGWLMLIIIIAGLRLYGLPWWVCVFALFWPPVMFSLRQLTALWMFGVVMAYRYQDKPFTAGIWIAFASLTKFFPAVMLVPLIIRRKWSALGGFVLVWLIALLLVVAICPDAIPRYIEVNLINSPNMIARTDNTAFLPSLMRFIGWPGFAFGAVFLAVIAWIGRKNWQTWNFLSVALLPISWIYSLLPLLPDLLKRPNVFAILALVIPLLVPSLGETTALAFIPLFILAGISGYQKNPATT
ncbi:MAG: DUF2029 domain-containing protein [Chloroflexi bacterium]|nr:DUF2029 domain-containing protein [Chloroflexota bacterium]